MTTETLAGDSESPFDVQVVPMASESIPILGPRLVKRSAKPLPARFVDRPNRFTARVVLRSGKLVRAHLPNPGRLTGTLVPGCQVLLDGPYPSSYRCRYKLVAAREGRVWVCTITTYVNSLFPLLLQSGLFPELPASNLRAEVRRGQSRFDFALDSCLIELKSVTLARNGVGMFPDAITERGRRHVLELARFAQQGQPAAIIFMAQRGDVTAVTAAADIDPAFAEALRRARDAGVQLLACALWFARDGARRAWRVPVVI